MTNQELLAKIEEWVEDNEEDLLDDLGHDIITTTAVDSFALITYIRTLVK